MAELTAFSAAQAEALSRWLQQLSALHGASEKTVQAYARDLRGFLAFLSQHHGAGEGLGALDALPHTDLRAWMAAERGRGLSARSLARSLSAVKNFLGWLSQQHGFDATTALSARSPKFRRKLPRPLTVEGAQEVLSDIGIYAAQDWIGARDTAVVTLTYADGRIAVIKNSRRAVYGYDQRVELLGSKGLLQAQNMLENTVVKSTTAGVTGAYTSTVVRWEDELSKLQPLESTPLSSGPVAAAGAVHPTLYEVGVNPEGIPLHCVLMESSGDSASDEVARIWIMGRRFRPRQSSLSAEAMTWGRVLVLWGASANSPKP